MVRGLLQWSTVETRTRRPAEGVYSGQQWKCSRGRRSPLRPSTVDYSGNAHAKDSAARQTRCGAHGHNNGPNALQPRALQEHPSSDPRAAKSGPRAAQRGQERRKNTQGRPKSAQERPEWPKRAQERPKSAQRMAKSAPTASSQERLRAPKKVARSIQETHSKANNKRLNL